MTTHELAETLKRYAIDRATQGDIETMARPPGRSPGRELRELSVWYESLDAANREMVGRAIARAARDAVFYFASILDNAKPISDSHPGGRFRLTWIEDGVESDVISEQQPPLHELL